MSMGWCLCELVRVGARNDSVVRLLYLLRVFAGHRQVLRIQVKDNGFHFRNRIRHIASTCIALPPKAMDEGKNQKYLLDPDMPHFVPHTVA